MKSQIIKTILLAGAFLFFFSWFYKLVCVLLLVMVWRRAIISRAGSRLAFRVLVAVIVLAMVYVLPRYRYNTDDRVRLVYQDGKGRAVLPPLSHYLVNVLLPEEEIMNLGIWGARLGVTCVPYVRGGHILGQFQMDDRNGKIGNFYRPARKLDRSGLFMMSGTTSQVGNMLGLTHTQSVYLTRPQHFDPKEKYPVVFFCHGGLGNWKLYQGLWKELKDCIVLSVGTRDWSGIFGYRDIEELFSRQLPFLKSMGYRVDENNLHIIGLSNGGTAVDAAYKRFAGRFKTITFVSTGIHQTFPVGSKILLVGGGKDGSSASIPPAYRKLKAQGSPVRLFWDKKETHFILVTRQEEILDFLNEEISGHK